MPQLFPSSNADIWIPLEPEGILATFDQSCFGHKKPTPTALPASKAIAQTEPEGDKTEPAEKLLKRNSFAGLPLTWKTWKSQGIWKRPLKVREFA